MEVMEGFIKAHEMNFPDDDDDEDNVEKGRSVKMLRVDELSVHANLIKPRLTQCNRLLRTRLMACSNIYKLY